MKSQRIMNRFKGFFVSVAPAGQPVLEIVPPACELLKESRNPIHLWLVISHVQMYGAELSVREVKDTASRNWVNIHVSNSEYLNEYYDR